MQAELLECLERFQQAVSVHHHRLDSDSPDGVTLESAEAVLHARLDLYRCLLRAGWTPCKAILQQIDRDTRLAHERDDRWLSSLTGSGNTPTHTLLQRAPQNDRSGLSSEPTQDIPPPSAQPPVTILTR